MVFIYILELENSKYYIGKTKYPDFRLEQHFNSSGSQWTKKFKPIKLLELIPNCDDYDEDKYTKMYMDKYGINNVRGGSYVQIILDNSTIKNLERMSRGTNDKCFKCGSNEHFVNDCNDDCQYEDIWCCEYCDKEFIDEDKCLKHENNCKKINKNKIENKKIIKCNRCGRNGHNINDCYAKTNIDNEDIFDSDSNDSDSNDSDSDDSDYVDLNEDSDSDDYDSDDDNDSDFIDDSDNDSDFIDDKKSNNKKSNNKKIFCCNFCDKVFDTMKGTICHENMHCKNKPK